MTTEGWRQKKPFLTDSQAKRSDFTQKQIYVEPGVTICDNCVTKNEKEDIYFLVPTIMHVVFCQAGWSIHGWIEQSFKLYLIQSNC